MQKNKINIIFLDVDGVLNSRAYLNNHKDPEDEIDMRAVERLAKIYRQCNCKIVLSSSWRELCGDEMTQLVDEDQKTEHQNCDQNIHKNSITCNYKMRS